MSIESTTDHQARLETAVERALEHFWTSIATSYPECETGDVEPGTVRGLELYAQGAAGEWVRANTPRPALTFDQLQGLARLADDLSKGAHGEPVRSVALALRPDGLADAQCSSCGYLDGGGYFNVPAPTSHLERYR